MLANGLSLARILLAPVVALSLYRDGQSTGMLTLALMLAAGATDLLDGWVARRLGQTSDLGRVLDPLADKIFIGCICICLVLLRDFPFWLVALQGARDLAIVGVGSYLLRSRHTVIPASLFGKIATWAMALTILAHVLNVDATWLRLAHVLTALLIVGSGGDYARRLRHILRQLDQSPAAAVSDASSSSLSEA